MSGKSVSSLTFDANDVNSIMAAIEKEMEGLANPEISGWRLPTLSEMKYIKDNITEINNRLTDEEVNLQTFYGNNEIYYFLDEGTLKLYYIGCGIIEQDIISGKTNQSLRIFTPMTLTN